MAGGGDGFKALQLALDCSGGAGKHSRTTYGMETQSHGRGLGSGRLHAFSPVVVERPVRERAARAWVRLADRMVLQAGVWGVPDNRLLAHQCGGFHPYAQKRSATPD